MLCWIRVVRYQSQVWGFFKNYILYISLWHLLWTSLYFRGDRGRTWVGGEAENLKRTPHSVWSLMGSISWPMSSWPEPKSKGSRLTHWATQARREVYILWQPKGEWIQRVRVEAGRVLVFCPDETVGVRAWAHMAAVKVLMSRFPFLSYEVPRACWQIGWREWVKERNQG